jgi:hypothetical protein
MSTSRRKIGFYSMEFTRRTKNDDERFFFDKDLFCGLIEFINTEITDEEKLKKNRNSNKATALELYESYEKNAKQLVKVIFKTCKYNHSPDYMSSEDGSERESDKSLDEGEKERTHLLGMFENDELMLMLEERRSGISISGIVSYINSFIKKYIEVNDDIKGQFRLKYSIVPSEDFEGSLDGLNRVCGADIYTHKQLLGSDGLAIMNRDDRHMKDEIVISCKVKKGESLITRNLKSLYHSAISEGQRITRIRIHGKDEHNTNVILDSDIFKRVEYIDTALNDAKGTVDSYAFFSKIEEIFGVDTRE